MATLNPTQRDVVFPVLLFLLLLLLLFFFYLSPRNQNLPLPLTPNFPSSSPSSNIQTTHQTVQAPRAASFPSSSSSDEYVSTRGVPSNSIDGAASASATDDESVDKEIIEMRIEKGLARARAAIREAIRSKNYTSRKEETFIPRGDVYRNPYAFHQSYIEMEKRFKIWTYREGDLPLVHNGPVNNIYAIEGQFMDELERGNSRLVARDPDEAHVFYLPMSITRIVQYMYTSPINYSANYQERLVTDYIRVIANKYPYWNRSRGADHFLLSCHDWAPEISMVTPDLYKNFIRVLCNANTSERFQPMRDISLPEVNIPPGKLGPLLLDKPPNHRHILAFFAGRESGYMRTLLFNSWKENDDEIQVYEHLPANKSYSESMADSRFCLCPSGWEVASPRIVESITVGCVPVIVSDYYVLPFSEVLDWGKFSVHVPSDKIPEIKKILKAVPFSRYLEMQKRVKQLQRHFVINRPTKPYDLLNMIFHSIWLRRLNVRLPLQTS